MTIDRVFLLGAGASKDAGLPISTEMTEIIVDDITSGATVSFDRRTPLALNYAVAAIAAHDAARGGGAYDGVDVERVFAAVQMLADRDSVLIAPFVQSWVPAVENLGPPPAPDMRFDRALRSAVMEPRSVGNSAGRLIGDLIFSQTRRDSQRTYQQLEDTMISVLCKVLADTGSVEYLTPVLPRGAEPSYVVTLNYDRSVEEVADQHDIVWDTGITSWPAEPDWSWDDSARMRLLKLHGSVDWVYANQTGVGGLNSRTVETIDNWRQEQRNVIHQTLERRPPALIFGAQGKLRAEGPFLSMLRAFDRLLSRTAEVVVVGYSFRDDHINDAIRRWFNQSTTQRLTIIDPALPLEPQAAAYGSFTHELLAAVTAYEPSEAGGSYELVTRDGVRLLRCSAAEGLAQLEPPAVQ